jgi:hypothetical protein
MAFCIPRATAATFLNAVRSGQVDIAALMHVSSEDRMTVFEPIFGKDLAHEVNAEYEKKLLLVDQQAGLVRWAQNVAGLTPKQRLDYIEQIKKLNRVLDPVDQKSFLADLAAQRVARWRLQRQGSASLSDSVDVYSSSPSRASAQIIEAQAN